MSDRTALVVHNVASMRADASSDAEQVSQALFGEAVRVSELGDAWARVVTPDGYSGWMLRAHLAMDARAEGESRRVRSLFAPARLGPSAQAETVTLLPLGVEVRVVDEARGVAEIDVPTRGRWFLDAADLASAGSALPPPTGSNLVSIGQRLRGVPYLWGGRSTFGIDCSGFTQLCHALCGVLTPRDADQQADWEGAEPVSRAELCAGDLVFFGGGSPSGREVSHVGLALGDGRFLHARGGYGVSVDALDEPPFDAIYWGARRLRR